MGFLIRLTLLFAVVFGVVFAITRALRANAHSKQARRIQDDMRALKSGIEQGLYSQQEYEVLANKLVEDCREEGIDVPDLPKQLPPRKGGKNEPN